jgi:hypothetical protein
VFERGYEAYRQELLIQRPNPIEFSQSHFELNIASKQLGFGTHSDTDSENLSRSGDVLSSDLEIGV